METAVKAIIATGGSLAGYLWGGWSYLLSILVVFAVIDFATGWVAAGMEGKLKSKISYVGAAKKALIFAIIAMCHMVDTALGNGHLVRDAAIFFYLANEALSIIENAGRIGLPLPTMLKNAVEVLREKGGAK
ncbi:holin [Tumebacillus algifaecis]|uniref:Holin n=1 Tax=Tumebacillus algifaecis TaxID=1214604 RepID=A0A223D5R1_9BACL|nr:holin [Tumebacillus algifaecis]